MKIGYSVDNYGIKQWYGNGKLHREDGPAVEHPDGTKSYWLEGKRYTKEEWLYRCTKLRLKKDGMDDADLDLMDQLGLLEGRILDYKSFKNKLIKYG